MKIRKHTTPLLSALAASMLCANFVAALSAHGAYQKYNIDGWGQPIITVLMQGLSHQRTDSGSSVLASGKSSTGEIPDVLAGQPDPGVSGSVSSGPGNGSGDASGDRKGMETSGSGNNIGDGTGDGSGNAQNPGTSGSGNNAGFGSSNGNGSGNAQNPGISGSGNNAGSGFGNGSHGQENPDAALDQPKQYAFTEVTPDYFDDALFIGDSRVEGVKLYSGWDNLTYYAENGMTVYNMFQSKTAQVDGQTLTIEEALQKRSFGKIYLEIGINEMGTGTVDSFMEAYEAAVAHLQELQPDAIIYVCGIMYVKQTRSESDPIFNNPAIQEKNDRIAALADGENIFYLDINEVVTDESGHLNPDYTWDEVHLLGKYDVIWLEYFSSHGIVKDAKDKSLP
nr:GDSL-type esterase/lipase family protein [uncultured Acetatifactor sp.]